MEKEYIPYLVINYARNYFVKHHFDSTPKYPESNVENILEFIIDKIPVAFSDQIFQQSVGISMGMNCDPLLTVYIDNVYLFICRFDTVQ